MGLIKLHLFCIAAFLFIGSARASDKTAFSAAPAPCVVSTYTMYNAKTGTIRWSTASDWIRNLGGTIAYPAGAAGASVTLTGTGTTFNTDCAAGDVILLQSAPGSSFGTVTGTPTATSMTVTLTSAVSAASSINYGKRATPTANDNIYIGNSNIAVAATDAQVDATGCQASSITINQQAANLSVSINSNYDLTVSGTIGVASGSSNSYTNSMNVNAGTLNATGTISLGTHNQSTSLARLLLTSGTVTAQGDIAFKTGRYYCAAIDMTGGAGTINLYGNIQYTVSTDIGEILPGTTSNFNFCSSATTQYLYTGFGTGGDPWFSYANLYCNNTSAGGMVMSGVGNNAGQIINIYIQSGKFLNQLTSGKLLGGTLFSLSNGATYETYGASANSTVPTTFTTCSLGATSTVKFHTTDNPWIDHVTYGNLYIEPAVSCGFYFKDATPAYTIQGNLYVGDGTITTFIVGQANTSMVVGGDLTIKPNATFNANTKIIDTYVAGNWIDQGTYTCGTSSVVLNGTAQQSVSCSAGTETFYNFVVNNSYTSSYAVVMNCPSSITNTLTLTNGIVNTTATNLMSLPSTASSSPGSAVSFIDGPIAKTGTTAFVFPTGNASKWARIAVGAPTASTTFKAQYFKNVYADVINMAATPTPQLDHVSGKEYWYLDRTAGTGNATVTLYWEDAAWSGITVCDNTDLRVAHYNGSAWENNNNSVSTTGTCTGATPGTISTTAVVNSFSPFTFGTLNNANTLPIELLEFTAVPNKEKVDLKWSTATETDNKFFSVEKSKDGMHFEWVVDVAGAGNSTTLKEYFESDYKPYEGVSYYRLKQTDHNGNFKYSQIVPVNFIVDKGVQVFPNPSNKNENLAISIQGYKDQEILVVLRDIQGKEFYSKVFIASENNQLFAVDALKNIPAGTYIVVASSLDKVYHQKLVVK